MQPGFQRFLVLSLLAFVLTVTGAHPLAMLCLVLLVGQCWLTGGRRSALVVVVLAGLTAGVVMRQPGVGLGYGLAAAGGMPVAVLMRRGWSYGWRLAVVSVLAFLGAAVIMAVDWKTLRHETTMMINARIAAIEASGVSNDALVQAAKWMDVNYLYLSLGSMFGTVLLLCAFMLSVLERWQRDPADVVRRKPTGFQRMHVPDWVVWIGIAAALLCFADQRWPHTAVRVVAWNAAVGLAFLYWLNGLSIVLYALSVFKATAFGMFMFYLGFVLFNGMLPMLSVLGLFDTWYDFRMRLRRLALLRRLSNREGGRHN